MFTERELQIILKALENERFELDFDIVRLKEMGREITSLHQEQGELNTLVNKVHKLFLEA